MLKAVLRGGLPCMAEPARSEASQPVFAPHGPHLFIGRKFATGGRSFRGHYGSTLLRRKRHG